MLLYMESKASDVCKKYVDLMMDFYDKYHQLKNKKDYFENECDLKDIKIDELKKENEQLNFKYDKLLKDVVGYLNSDYRK